MENTRKLELIITALKESLSQKVSSYEEQIANIRAEATILLEESGERIASLEQRLTELSGEGNVDVPSEDS